MTEQFPPFGYPGAEPAAAPAPKARHRRRTALIAGGCAIILAIAGVATFLSWPDPGTPTLAATFGLPGNGILQAASFSADGKLLALVEGVNTGPNLVIWDTATHADLARVTVPHDPVAGGAIAFSPDDSQVTVIDNDGAVLRWNLATGKRSVITPAGDTEPLDAALSGDGSTLAAPDSTTGTDVWDLRTGRLIADLPEPDGLSVSSIVLDGTGQTMAVIGGSRFYLWSIPSRKVIATLPFPPGANASSAPLLTADGKDAVATQQEGNDWFTIWDVATRSNVTPHDARWPRKFAVLYLAAAGAVCATQDAYESFDLWDTTTGSHIRTVGSPSHPSGYLFAVGPGGHEVLTTPHIRAQNRVATLWDIP